MTNLVLKSEHYINDRAVTDTLKMYQHGNQIFIVVFNGRHKNGMPREGKMHLSKEQAEVVKEWLACVNIG